MSDTIEQAQQGMEHAEHAAKHGDVEPSARKTAVLIAILAACLALAEMGEKASQNEYLTHHISVSDTFAFLQGKNARRAAYDSAADVIESLPAQDAAAHQRVERREAAGGARRRIDGTARPRIPCLSSVRTRHRSAADRHRAGVGLSGDAGQSVDGGGRRSRRRGRAVCAAGGDRGDLTGC